MTTHPQDSESTLYNSEGVALEPQPQLEIALPFDTWRTSSPEEQSQTPLALDASESIFEDALTDPSTLREITPPWIRFDRSKFTDGRTESAVVTLRRSGYRGQIYVVGDVPPDVVNYLLRLGVDATTTSPIALGSDAVYGVTPPWFYRPAPRGSL